MICVTRGESQVLSGVLSSVNSWSEIGGRAASSEECWQRSNRRKDTGKPKETVPAAKGEESNKKRVDSLHFQMNAEQLLGLALGMCSDSTGYVPHSVIISCSFDSPKP